MKILCPFHEERTPSCHLYEEHYHCFSCGARGPIDALDVEVKATRKPPQPPEDILNSVNRIVGYPVKNIRGFDLHFDDAGYYLIYPFGKFYLKRYWVDGYYYPRGHKVPVYQPNLVMGTGKLYIVEGQFNALTLVDLDVVGETVVSPGPATKFNTKEVQELCLQYETVYIIVDKDVAGVVAGHLLYSFLVDRIPVVQLIAVEEDFNDIYVREGKEKAKQTIAQILGLS